MLLLFGNSRLSKTNPQDRKRTTECLGPELGLGGWGTYYTKV